MIDRGRALDVLRGRTVHVVGASGAEGVALLLYLVGRHGLKGVVAHDFSTDDRAFARSFRRANPGWERRKREEMLRNLRRLPVRFELGDRYLASLPEADVVLAGQNWFNYASNLPAVPDAVARGADLYGVVDLAMALFHGTRVGVTGSNGKSTTSRILQHLLAGSTNAAVLQGGNDRSRQVELARLEESSPDERLVWEVSNRHLRDRPVLVDVAVLTNITRNHIEDHGSWEAYIEAKARLPLHADGAAVMSAVDPVSRTLHDRVKAEGATLWTFGDEGAEGPKTWFAAGRVHWAGAGAGSLDASTFPFPGAHNRLNLCAAVAAALAAGADPSRLEAALKTVTPLAGRLEEVAEQDGVRWIYDIQATTAPAAAAGIAAIGARHRIVLIVGGEDKGMDYSAMADAAARHADRVLAMPGSGSERFLKALGDRVAIQRFDDLDALLAVARDVATPGSAVLLSPGCAFFSRDYLEGGPVFAKRVRSLLADV